jgi:hypothetical protein
MHPPVEVGERLCVAFEACIHASEGAHVPHDHKGGLNFVFILSVYFEICAN